ncbi:phage gp6-like head-tail connector protein [Candidatus Dojkabacteria bacterium]|uniref:Phage gp6-like head-tail connector protein n=1 Tax=Candidatus Dojkabacteria bacterium TaxID=2099670 RepID=A0A5C7J8V3_9BACT|nr:MAG: phage gp6-like head-tail connector protein [Candidatus Dojkabacteria bacterium]
MRTPLALPEVEPVSVTELARNLRLFTGEGEYTGAEQAELLGFIQAARADAEHYTGRYFAKQTVRFVFPAFASVLCLHSDCRELVQIRYFDTDNTQQTLTNTELFFITGDVLICANSVLLPKTYGRLDAVGVDVVLGVEITPPSVKQAILMMASHWYENRETSSPLQVREVPYAYQWLLDSHRLVSIG